ncbi:MAG: MbtH family protein [Pikeienuella sp.]
MSDADETEYAVVISEDGRHSIWPGFRPPPWGWSAEGFRGSRAACLAHIDEVWTELRPASVAVSGEAS